MKHKNTTHNFWSFSTPQFPFSLHEEGEEDEWLQHFHESSGLSISEDEHCMYVEAAVPGIDPKKIEMTFEDGTLWIRAMKEEENEDRKKKFYRKARNAFSYRIALPVFVDRTKSPETAYKNGILQVVFTKIKGKQPTKISIKSA